MTNCKEIIVTKETAGCTPVGIPPFSFRALNASNWTQCESSWREKTLMLEKNSLCQFYRSLVQEKCKCRLSVALIINCITLSICLYWTAENISCIGKRNYNWCSLCGKMRIKITVYKT